MSSAEQMMRVAYCKLLMLLLLLLARVVVQSAACMNVDVDVELVEKAASKLRAS